MADPTEPKKETVRIAVTPPPSKPAEAGDTARINLPARPPANVPPPPPAQTLRPPIAKPLIPPAPSKPVQAGRFGPPPVPSAARSNLAIANPAPAPLHSASPQVSPKKETARITVLPAPASVQMKKTQPLIDMPAAVAPPPLPVTVAPEMAGTSNTTPMALYWALVGISAVILIIQILNYIS